MSIGRDAAEVGDLSPGAFSDVLQEHSHAHVHHRPGVVTKECLTAQIPTPEYPNSN